MNILFSLLFTCSFIALNCSAVEEGANPQENRAPAYFDHLNPHKKFPIYNNSGCYSKNIKENLKTFKKTKDKK